MNKVIITIAFLVVAFAFAEANIRQCRRICHKNQPSKIRCVMDGNGCRKMKSCTIVEENCRRRMHNQKPLKITHSYRCHNIKMPFGYGRCAPKKRMERNIRPNCRHILCNHSNPKLKCYRTHNKQCQLLTDCQLRHANCHRGRNNALISVNRRHCRGLRSGQALKPCVDIPPYRRPPSKR